MQRMNSRNYRSMIKEFSSHTYHENNYICNILKKVFSMILYFLPLVTRVRKGPKFLVPRECSEP